MTRLEEFVLLVVHYIKLFLAPTTKKQLKLSTYGPFFFFVMALMLPLAKLFCICCNVIFLYCNVYFVKFFVM